MSTMNLGFCIPWIHIFLYWTYVSISPARTSIRTMSYFPGTHVCAFYSFSQLYIQIKQQLTCSCCCKYFQLEIRWKKLIFYCNFLPLLSSDIITLWLNVTSAEQSHACGSTCPNTSRKLAHDPTQHRYFTRCTHRTYWLPNRLR
jgi:hypothetical protein